MFFLKKLIAEVDYSVAQRKKAAIMGMIAAFGGSVMS